MTSHDTVSPNPSTDGPPPADVAALEQFEHYRMVAEATTDIVLRVRLDGVIEWVSPAVTEVLGWLPSQWVGKRNLEIVRPDHRDEFMEQVRQVVATGGDSRFEFPVVRADGTSVWMESIGRLANPDAEAPYRVIRLRDITAQHQAVKELAASESLFRQAMADAPIGMCLVAPDGGFLAVNDALCVLLGRDADTLQATSWQEMTHPDDLSADQALVDDVIAGRRDSYRLRKRYLRPDGEVVWGDLAVSGVRDGEGTMRFFVSQIADVTASVTFERQLEQARERFQLLAENASDMVFRSGPDGRMEWVSPSVTALLGWDAEALIGTRTLDLVHPDDRSEFERNEALTRGGHPAHYNVRLRRNDSDWQWVAVTKRPVMDDAGNLVGRIGSARDISAEYAATRALAEQRDYLQAVTDSELDMRVRCAPVWDEHGRITDLTYLDANPRALDYFQRNAEQVLGTGMLDLFPSQRASGLFDRYVDCHLSGEPLSVDDLHIFSDVAGQDRWIDLRAVRVGDTLSINWRDTTERHLAQRDLRRSEARFRLLAQNTSDIIVLATDTGEVEWVSSSLTTHLGWQPDEWIGQRPEQFTHPDDAAHLQRRRDSVTHGENLTARLRFRDNHGTYHWVESRAAPFRDDTGTVHGVMAAISIIDDLVAQEAALEHQATHDTLTGLLNRQEAYDRITAMMSHAPRTGTRTFVAFVDVDNLKTVNDDYGHAAGDELLRIVATRTTETLRDEDIVARVGGDELLLVLPGIQDSEGALTLLNRVLSAINVPHTFRPGHQLLPRVSIGLTEITPGDDAETAVHRADTAMYAAKASGGNHVRLSP